MVAALLMEQNDEFQLLQRRYMQLESVQNHSGAVGWCLGRINQLLPEGTRSRTER